MSAEASMLVHARYRPLEVSRRQRAVTLVISISSAAIATLFSLESLQQHLGVGGAEVAGATIPAQGRTRVAANTV
jgi:hypothetical protein